MESIPGLHTSLKIRALLYIPLSLYLHSVIYLRFPFSSSPSPSQSSLISLSSSPSLSPSVSHQTKIILKGEAPRRVHFVLHIKSPINILHYFAETEKHLKTDTFKKRTSIATVRDQYIMYAIFPSPLVSHYRQPLKHNSLNMYFPRWPILGV